MIQKITKILALVAITGLSNVLEAQFKWSPAGPVYTAGRSRNMVVDKTDPSSKTLYVGSTSSGVFKSTDGGANWAPIDDQGSVRNISYMAQASDGTIYAATGEGFLRTGQKAKALPGTGLYKLTGNSLTQVVSAVSVGTVINRVAVSPANPAVIALATNIGIFVSLDAGSSFTQPTGITTGPNIGGQDVKFDAAGNLFCSVGAETGLPTSTLTASKIYKSTSTSLSSFIDITPTSGVLADQNYGRIELGIAPTNNNIIYASCANKNTDGKNAYSANLKGLFVSYDAGTTWALLLQGAPALDPLGNGADIYSGDYAQCLLVSPTDPNTLYFSGYSMRIWIRRQGAAGGSNSNPIGDWYKIGNNFATNSQIYLHENIHDVKIIGSNPTKYYFVTDAGIYRCTDLVSPGQLFPPTFQPFYNGLVTGQFNSVSIERFPIGANSTSTVSGSKVTPYSGFIGGTGGNGVTYYSGTYSLVTQESSYLAGDVYNAEYSKILPNVAFATIGTGGIARSSNIKTSSPITYSVNGYTGALSKLAPNVAAFSNANVSTGTPFKMWEYYGQIATNPDNIYYYNDSLRVPASVSTQSDLVTTRTWSLVGNRRPDRAALIDSIVVRTASVAIAQVNNPSVPFNTGKIITIKLNNNYINTSSITVLSSPQLTCTGDVGPEQATVTLNNSTLNDDIVVSFSTPPFADKTAANTNPGHYRVYATIFYKYKQGDSITVTDNNISTKINTYKTLFPAERDWRYGTPPSYAVTVTPNAAITNPTYAIAPTIYAVSPTSTTLPFTVNLVGAKQFTVTQYGTYSVSAKLVDFSLSVITDTNVSGPTYTFVVQPGGTTRTVAASPTPTAPIVFIVAPSAATIYTITQSGSGTLTAVSNFTIGANSYILNPGNITQSSPIFTLAITPTTTPGQYTMTALSSNTLIGANTTSTTASFPIRSSSIAGSTIVPFAARNQPVKIPMRLSARLAVAVANDPITGGTDPAVAVSKNPLALNDAGNFVRISQNGCMTDDASGNPTTNTVSVVGRPIILEWSKSGTELYYATDANKVYRVSHINDIMDLSTSSYNGKFHSDVFMYNTSGNNAPNTTALNLKSPYRTTLIGSFNSPVTSISVSNDDTKMVLTFKNPAQTGTTGIVMYSDNSNIKTSNAINWVKKDNGLAGLTTYCSMIEKDDNKLVFAGTDKGLYFTSDITTGTWSNVNTGIADEKDKIPNVQVFDVKQQVMFSFDCYNSGEIYVATNGRGVWSNSKFLKEFYVGIEESEFKNKTAEALHIYPNPTNANVYISYAGFDGQSLNITVMDLSGRIVKAEAIGKVESSDDAYTMDTANLNSGVYFVTLSSDGGMKKTAKLIVTK